MQEFVDALANWLWQGSAVALAATAILRPARRISATTRYQIWWITLFIVLALPIISFQLPASSFQQQPGLHSVEFAVGAAAGSVSGSEIWERAAGSWKLPLPPWTGALLALVWLAAATVSLSRTAVALVALRRLKRLARPFPEAGEARLPTWLVLRALGRPARLVVSDHIHAAAVLGLTSPSIAIAPPTIAALDDVELDQIVVHEWAHVQRRDDLARLAQRVIVGLAGLHPAVWWIDRQLSLERETACDDWAVQATGSARGFAVCLTKLAALPGRPAQSVLMRATPAALSSELTARVVRLLDRHRNTSTMRTFGPPLVVAPVLGALALTVASVELVVTSRAAPDAPPVPKLLAIRSSPKASEGWSSGEPRRTTLPLPSPPRPRVSARSEARTPGQSRRAIDSPQSGTSSVPAAGSRSLLGQPHRDVQALTITPRAVGEDPVSADELPGTRVSSEIVSPPAAPAGSEKTATPWGAAADAGVTVGRGSQKAAVATAGFFTRVSKSISGVF